MTCNNAFKARDMVKESETPVDTIPFLNSVTGDGHISHNSQISRTQLNSTFKHNSEDSETSSSTILNPSIFNGPYRTHIRERSDSMVSPCNNSVAPTQPPLRNATLRPQYTRKRPADDFILPSQMTPTPSSPLSKQLQLTPSISSPFASISINTPCITQSPSRQNSFNQTRNSCFVTPNSQSGRRKILNQVPQILNTPPPHFPRLVPVRQSSSPGVIFKSLDPDGPMNESPDYKSTSETSSSTQSTRSTQMCCLQPRGSCVNMILGQLNGKKPSMSSLSSMRPDIQDTKIMSHKLEEKDDDIRKKMLTLLKMFPPSDSEKEKLNTQGPDLAQTSYSARLVNESSNSLAYSIEDSSVGDSPSHCNSTDKLQSCLRRDDMYHGARKLCDSNLSSESIPELSTRKHISLHENDSWGLKGIQSHDSYRDEIGFFLEKPSDKHGNKSKKKNRPNTLYSRLPARKPSSNNGLNQLMMDISSQCKSSRSFDSDGLRNFTTPPLPESESVKRRFSPPLLLPQVKEFDSENKVVKQR